MAVFRATLQQAAQRSHADLPARVLDACDVHFELLVRWNATHNLTRITDPAEAARRHYLDCLLPLLSWPVPQAFMDVGSGAGFPGLLASALWPSARGTLVEPARKRASFLALAAGAMGLLATDADPSGVSVRTPQEAEAGQLTAGVVLSRATFSEGGRGELRRYAEPGGAVVMWGHPHDRATWAREVGTWPGWGLTWQEYTVADLEPRALMGATAPGGLSPGVGL